MQAPFWFSLCISCVNGGNKQLALVKIAFFDNGRIYSLRLWVGVFASAFWWRTISLWHARRKGLIVKSFAAAGIGFWVPGSMVAIGVSWRIHQLCCFLLVVLVGAVYKYLEVCHRSCIFLFFEMLKHIAVSVFALILQFFMFIEDIAMIHAFTGTYGINYGRFANNIPSPDRVVTLLKAAKIKNVRIYNVDHSVFRAFRGSRLELEVVVPNEILVNMSSSTDHASNWVKQNIQPYLPDTDIRGIAVGNEILAIEDEEIQEALVGAVKNIYSAVDRLHLKDKIVIWTPHSQAVYQNSFPPSSCTFKESLLPYMRPLLQFFSQIGSPFFVNVYPFLSYKSNPKDIDINYSLFKPNPGIHDAKTKLHYDNMFDAQIDSAYAALEAAGFGHMEIRVSETGWASHGDEDEPGATVENARTFNFNLRKRLNLRKGTPFRPKIVIKAYVFALFNENQKPGPTSERIFGLYKPDGTIAYDIGFPGLKSSSASSLLSRKVCYWNLLQTF